MNEQTRVHVVDFKRRNLYLRFRDPATGKSHVRSAGTRSRREAERAAAKWEAELQEALPTPPSRMTWQALRDRIDADYLPTLAKKSGERLWGVLDSFETAVSPKMVSAIDADAVLKWQRHLRAKKLSEATVKSYSATLKAAFRWAESIGAIQTAPNVPLPKRARSSDRQTPMKGRAITAEEFRDLLEATVRVVGEPAAPSWTHLLEGLWVSGLRLGEALSLSWTDEDELHVVENEQFLLLAIPGERQKSHRDELLPITPDFEQFLRDHAPEERQGFVFPLRWQRTPSRGDGRRLDTVSGVITAIGREAGVVVSRKNGRTKYASAHDLRRSFGDRWAARVPSLTLKTLMRHASIETTERYYITRRAETVMGELQQFRLDE